MIKLYKKTKKKRENSLTPDTLGKIFYKMGMANTFPTLNDRKQSPPAPGFGLSLSSVFFYELDDHLGDIFLCSGLNTFKTR